MLLKETLKGMNRLKSNCSVRKQYLCTLHGTQSSDSYRPVHQIHTPNPCSKSMHETTETTATNMRYPKSEITNPQSYCGEVGGPSSMMLTSRFVATWKLIVVVPYHSLLMITINWLLAVVEGS